MFDEVVSESVMIAYERNGWIYVMDPKVWETLHETPDSSAILLTRVSRVVIGPDATIRKHPSGLHVKKDPPQSD